MGYLVNNKNTQSLFKAAYYKIIIQ